MNPPNRVIHNFYHPSDDDVDYQIKFELNVDSSEYEGIFSYENGRIQVEFDGLIKYDYFSSNEKIQCHTNGTVIHLVRILSLWSDELLKKTYAIFEYALLQNSHGRNSENLFVKSSLQFDTPPDIFGYLSHQIRHTRGGNLLVKNELKTINSKFGEDTLSIINDFEYHSDNHLLTVKNAHIFAIDFSKKKNLKEIIVTVDELTHLINLLTYTKNEPSHISLMSKGTQATLLKTKNRGAPKTFNNFFDIYQNLQEWGTICKKWPEVYQKHREFILRLEDLREERSPFVRVAIYAMIFEGLSNNIEYVKDKTLTESECLEIESLQTPIPDPRKRTKYKEMIKQISENILSDEQTEKIASISWPKAGTSYIDAIRDSVFLYRILGKNRLESILSAVILQRNSFAHSGLFNSAPAKLSTIEASIAGYFMELLIITSLLTECNLTNDEREHFVRDLRCNIEFGIWLRNN